MTCVFRSVSQDTVKRKVSKTECLKQGMALALIHPSKRAYSLAPLNLKEELQVMREPLLFMVSEVWPGGVLTD